MFVVDLHGRAQAYFRSRNSGQLGPAHHSFRSGWAWNLLILHVRAVPGSSLTFSEESSCAKHNLFFPYWAGTGFILPKSARSETLSPGLDPAGHHHHQYHHSLSVALSMQKSIKFAPTKTKFCKKSIYFLIAIIQQ